MTDVHVAGAHATVRAPGFTDEVATEEPLEIRVDGEPVAVTMRTPGHDEELALGFLFGEALIEKARPVLTLLDANAVEVEGPLARELPTRRFYTTSSCGVCGKGAIEEIAVHAPRLPDHAVADPALLAALPERLTQPTFERTGGLHATGLFTNAGELVLVREDVGRHNAMDKAIGWALRSSHAPEILCVSGRLSFELVQKAVRARATTLVGVGAPTSLAVRLAHDRNLTLAGFARNGRVNLYTHG